jgi:hypothetical protein
MVTIILQRGPMLLFTTSTRKSNETSETVLRVDCRSEEIVATIATCYERKEEMCMY